MDADRILDQAKVSRQARSKKKTVRVTRRAEEIVTHAIEYFNIHGAARISINRLAESLNMSPGNLHYHFRTNSDLYSRLFQVLDEDIRVILEIPQMPMTLPAVVRHQIAIQACFWKHRYFFRDLDYLINQDDKIFVSFLHLQNWSVDQLIRLQAFYRENFGLAAIEPPHSDLEMAQNCWMMWTSWIRWEAIANAGVVVEGQRLNDIFHRLAWHHFSLHAPFMKPQVGFAIAKKLKKLLSVK